MMTSSNGNIFRVTGRWIPRTKASDAELWFFICAWINDWVNNREAGDLRRHRAHYDVTVMAEKNTPAGHHTTKKECVKFTPILGLACCSTDALNILSYRHSHSNATNSEIIVFASANDTLSFMQVSTTSPTLISKACPSLKKSEHGLVFL